MNGDQQHPVFHLERNKRAGHLIVTFYEEAHPLGSLILDPTTHSFIDGQCDEFIKRLEENRIAEIERARIRSYERKGKRNNSATEG